MSLEVYAAYLIACIVIIIVPGPTVTLIVANSLKHGTRAGLLNVAGTQAGLGVMVLVAGIGLSSVIAALGHWFEWVRLAGAAYLIWLGWKMFRSADADLDGAPPAKPPRGGFFLQGALVALSNPKTLLFFGAFFPQFLDPARDHATQIAIMGATALAFAALSDGAYALLSGKAGHLLSRSRVRLLSKLSGGFLVGGGLWLASTRAN
jgi:threonine/homoserine/homoserine lactone efflux protein